jgi:hypothetical protein
VLRCNRALLGMLGKFPCQVLGRPRGELIPAAPGAGDAPPFLCMLETGERATAELALGDRWLRTVAEPIWADDATPAGAVYLLSDIGERKCLEEQLRRSQKLAALGQLAAGVAHDVNNLLTAVTGNVSLLLAGLPEQDPARMPLQAIDQSAWRAAGVTRQLLRLGRPAAAGVQSADLRSRIDEVVALLRRTLDRRITVEVRAASDLWAVQADHDQLNQVLLDLCLNARDAMPEGGPPPAGGGQRRAGRGGGPAARGSAPRGIRVPGGQRHGARHPGGIAATRLRAVLHDQGAGQGDGVGAGRGPRHRAPAPGLDRVRAHAEPGHPV